MSVPLSVDDCLADILGRLKPHPAYDHLLLEALGLTADRDVLAPRAIPEVDGAAVDGFAVRAIDTQAASAATPVVLAVQTGAVVPGSCVPIAAGSPMPAGSDAVVAGGGGGAELSIAAPVYSGHLVKRAGDDLAKGDLVLAQGDLVGPRDVGLLAGLGIEQVSVAPRPRVVVISTGAELVEPGKGAGAGEIHDANSYLLAATVRAAGGIAYRVQVPSDDPAVFAEVLDDQLVRADAVVTTSGNLDVVGAALRREPGLRFRELAMHPGPTLGYGFMGPESTPIFALPADPVAASISFAVFVAPALRRLTGRSPEMRPLFRAQLTEDLASTLGKRHYVCADFVSDAQGARVQPTGSGGDTVASLAAANALIMLREDVALAKAGEPVPIILLDRDY